MSDTVEKNQEAVNEDANEAALREVLKSSYQTKRSTVEALEDVLYKPHRVLDHGFVRVVDYMGDDSAIVQAARVSYGKGTKKINQDRGLINYLLRHKHTTPFEMCDIKFHVKMPIFVARQWIRHRTASVNEYSARYSILGNEFYLPARENLSAQSNVNRQGRSDDLVPDDVAEDVLNLLKLDATKCYDHYIDLMNEDESGNVVDENKIGISRELARMNLTLNFYTEMYWKINLHNLLHFLRLRADSHAQYEIRVYAQVMLDIVKKWVPFVYEAFEDHIIGSVSISNKGLKVVKALINNEEMNQETSGMTKREWNELMASLELNL